jgi:hypothetical protein
MRIWCKIYWESIDATVAEINESNEPNLNKTNYFADLNDELYK